jgi:hypothetical protein
MSTNTILASAPLTTTNYVLKANGTTLGNSLIFDNGTNVGIGTSSPSGALQVSNAGYAIFSNSAHTQTPLSTGLSIGYNRSGANGEVSLVWGAPAAGFNFEIASVTSGTITPRMTITNAGNVGIGTSSPNLTNINRTVLDINGTSTSLLGLSVGGTAKSYLFQNGNDLFINSISGIMAFNVETANYMSFATTNAERMRITSGGDVGIGNINTAGYKLLVVAKDNTSSNYALVVTNNSLATLLYIRNDGYAWISQTAWAYGSDKRLKENINYIETGLEKILALKPAKFDYIDGSKDNIGWIAQDVQKVIPEAVLVNTNDERGYLSLKSDFIVPYLVKAIQEQQALITSLQARLETLENK